MTNGNFKITGNCENVAKAFMEDEYEPKASDLLNKATAAEWNYETNLTDANGDLAVRFEIIISYNWYDDWQKFV